MRIVDHFHHPQQCNVHWLLLTGGSVNPALHTEFIGCDLCLRGTDIVLWLYINPQRTDECFSLPSARGRSSCERLPPREPGGPSAQRHLPLWEVKLGPSLITLSAACWPTETSAENIMAQAQYLYLLFFVRTPPRVCLSTSPRIHFKSMTRLLQLSRAAAVARLQPLGFISEFSIPQRSVSLWSVSTERYLITSGSF